MSKQRREENRLQDCDRVVVSFCIFLLTKFLCARFRKINCLETDPTSGDPFNWVGRRNQESKTRHQDAPDGKGKAKTVDSASSRSFPTSELHPDKSLTGFDCFAPGQADESPCRVTKHHHHLPGSCGNAASEQLASPARRWLPSQKTRRPTAWQYNSPFSTNWHPRHGFTWRMPIFISGPSQNQKLNIGTSCPSRSGHTDETVGFPRET